MAGRGNRLMSVLQRVRKFLAPPPSYDRYFVNDLDRATNEIGLERIVNARKAFGHRVASPQLRRSYERDQFSPLPGVSFDRARFESVRERAVAALADPGLSPCAFYHGKQAEAQGIPREVITHDVRRYTSDVATVLPDAA